MASNLYPVLVVPDLKAACAFYQESFGSALLWEFGDPPGYAALSFGDVEIHLAEDASVAIRQDRTWIYLVVDDIEELYQRYLDAGVQMEGPPKEQPWGMREIVATDLNGFRYHIGSSIEGED